MSDKTHTNIKLPLGIRAFNQTVGALRSAGVPLLKLDKNRLMKEASKNTGLYDFGDDFFQEPLSVLIWSLENEAQLTALGRKIAHDDFLRLLENRLHMVEQIKQNPSILEQAVKQPLFILGPPRTGTSINHELFAQDPDNRVPMTWEVKHPFPLPETSTYYSDPRISNVDDALKQVDRIISDFKKMHPMGATLPQECAAITAHDFSSMIFYTQYNIPTYQAWLEKADLRPVYANHRKWLQLLQWKCPGTQWVLKSPAHLWAIDELLDEYPDAQIVQTHRDPLKVLASISSLIATLRTMASNHVDLKAIAEYEAIQLARGMEKTMAARDTGKLPNNQVLDVHFSEFMADPVAMIGKIYRYFGRELSDDAAIRMQRFLDYNPSDKHGKHSYHFDSTGLDLQKERRRYQPYQQRFNIESEVN